MLLLQVSVGGCVDAEGPKWELNARCLAPDLGAMVAWLGVWAAEQGRGLACDWVPGSLPIHTSVTWGPGVICSMEGNDCWPGRGWQIMGICAMCPLGWSPVGSFCHLSLGPGTGRHRPGMVGPLRSTELGLAPAAGACLGSRDYLALSVEGDRWGLERALLQVQRLPWVCRLALSPHACNP